MRIAVTGGTGFVGRHLVRHLARLGHEPLALSRRTGVPTDDVAALTRALRGADALVCCAGINRERDAQTYDRVHVAGTAAAIAAARAAGVRRLVLLSFLRARPDCGSPYHESKHAAEELVRASGLAWTVVKAGVIAGRGDHLVDHVSRALGTLPVFALLRGHEARMRPALVEDVARVLAAAALGDERLCERTVTALGPEELSLRAAVERIGAAADRRPRFVTWPLAAHRLLAAAGERVLAVPLVSTAQLWMLVEGIIEPAGAPGVPIEAPPADLAPATRPTVERLRAALPERRRFGLADLRC